MENFEYIKKFRKSNYIQFSPKGDYIVSVSGNQIVVIDTENLSEIHVFNDIRQPGKIAFSFNNEKLFSSESAIKKLGVFNLDNELPSRIYKVTKSNEYQNHNICFSTDDKKIICGIYNGKNNTISTLDIETSEVKHLKILENSFINKIEYCEKDNSYLFSVFSREGRIINGEIYSETYVLKWKYPFDIYEPSEIKSETVVEWRDISYNQNANAYATYVQYDQYNEMLIIIDDTISKELRRYVPSDRRHGFFNNLSWSKDGEYIALTYMNTVKIIRFNDKTCVKEYKVASASYSEFSNDGKLLLIGGGKSSYLINISELKVV
jgi:WD40 repeat protein